MLVFQNACFPKCLFSKIPTFGGRTCFCFPKCLFSKMLVFQNFVFQNAVFQNACFPKRILWWVRQGGEVELRIQTRPSKSRGGKTILAPIGSSRSRFCMPCSRLRFSRGIAKHRHNIGCMSRRKCCRLRCLLG